MQRDAAAYIAAETKKLVKVANESGLGALAFMLECCHRTATEGEDVRIERMLAEMPIDLKPFVKPN